MTTIDKPRIDPSAVTVGQQVQRRPYGRICTVSEVPQDRAKVLIKDGRRSIWMNMSTLIKDWTAGGA